MAGRMIMPPTYSLHIKRRPEALGQQKLSQFSFQASKFFFFFMFKDELRAGKFWNLNAKTV